MFAGGGAIPLEALRLGIKESLYQRGATPEIEVE
jgi:hypothetical protein